MKIILEAFNGNLTGKPIDVPENTTDRWKMILAQPLTAILGYSGKEIDQIKQLKTICTFRWIGKSVHLKDLGYDSDEYARIYVLEDIKKS